MLRLNLILLPLAGLCIQCISASIADDKFFSKGWTLSHQLTDIRIKGILGVYVFCFFVVAGVHTEHLIIITDFITDIITSGSNMYSYIFFMFIFNEKDNENEVHKNNRQLFKLKENRFQTLMNTEHTKLLNTTYAARSQNGKKKNE